MLELLPFCCLTSKKKGLGIFAFAANLEGSEVFEPRSIGPFGVRLSPELELIEVLDRDLAIAQPIEQVISECRREVSPLDGRQLFTERSAGQLLLDPSLLGGVRGTRQAVGKLEELLLFSAPRCETSFDELDDYAAGASPLAFGDGVNATDDPRRKADTSS